MPRSCDLVDRCGDSAPVLYRDTVVESVAQLVYSILCCQFAVRGPDRTGLYSNLELFHWLENLHE